MGVSAIGSAGKRAGLPCLERSQARAVLRGAQADLRPWCRVLSRHGNRPFLFGVSMLSFQQALDHATAAATPVGSERLPLMDARDRVLALPVHADRDLPPFDRSERDGFAVRSSDFVNGIATLNVTEEMIYAGCEPVTEITSGDCSQIMTGAPLPPGADAVVPVEKSRVNGGTVELNYDRIRPRIHVHGKGVDAAKDQELIGAGLPLDTGRLAVAASVGAAQVEVHRKVRVAILSTGDELIGVDESPRPSQIRDSNGPALRALLEAEPWIDVVRCDRVADDRTVLGKAIAAALDESDALVLTGGVSMGEKDFVPAVLRKCGVEQILHKIAIRPGKPFWFGRAAAGTIVFGLPGNPMSVQVTFREIAFPAIRKMGGFERLTTRDLHIGISVRLEKKLSLGQFIQARLISIDGGASRVEPIAHHGSGDFVSASRADGVIILPEGELTLEPGDPVRFHLWRDV